jgi:tetratricopeptide (TPR) repeat protein
MSPDTVVARAIVAADRALALDSASADAWAGRGIVLFYGKQPDYSGAVAALGRAAALDSMNAPVHHARGQVLRRLGDFAGAEAATRAAIAADPGFGPAYNQMALIAYSVRRAKEALALSDTSIALDPKEWQYWQIHAHVNIALRDTARARQDAEQAVKISPPAQLDYSLLVLAQALAAGGDTVGARQKLVPVLAKLPGEGALTPRYYQTALALIATGRRDDGLKTLERIKPRGAWLWSYMIMPSFDPVRADPRFVKLLDEARPPGATLPK